MINNFRLTHHILFYVVRGYMFRSLLIISGPFVNRVLQMLATYWDPTMFKTMPVCIPVI